MDASRGQMACINQGSRASPPPRLLQYQGDDDGMEALIVRALRTRNDVDDHGS